MYNRCIVTKQKSNHFGAALTLTDLLYVYSVTELLLLFLLDTRGNLFYAWAF